MTSATTPPRRHGAVARQDLPCSNFPLARRAVFKYEGKVVKPAASGTDYDEFLTHFTDSERVYAFVRIETGDELSKRAKFALITWVGPNIKAVQRAAVSTDKAFVKEIIKNYAKEILADQISEVQFDHVKAEVIKCG